VRPAGVELLRTFGPSGLEPLRPAAPWPRVARLRQAAWPAAVLVFLASAASARACFLAASPAPRAVPCAEERSGALVRGYLAYVGLPFQAAPAEAVLTWADIDDRTPGPAWRGPLTAQEQSTVSQALSLRAPEARGESVVSPAKSAPVRPGGDSGKRPPAPSDACLLRAPPSFPQFGEPLHDPAGGRPESHATSLFRPPRFLD
jgi:hypothetical protein